MADRDTDFMQDWQRLARQSWDAWSDFMRNGAASMPPVPGGDAAAGVERALESLKGYFGWMQTAGMPPQSAGADWSEWLRRSFGQPGIGFGSAFPGFQEPGAQGFAAMMQQWQDAFRPFAPQDAGWLHMPAFGITREYQQQQQEGVRALLEYGEQLRRYQALLGRVGQEGVERMERKLSEHDEPGRQIESLRALYDLWVDAAEEAYAEAATGEEFREVYGALVNAQMHVRSLQTRQVEQWCRELGMPTRSEVDSLGRRLQELRREVRAAGDAGLAAELAALREEFDALRARVGHAPGAKPVAPAAPAAPASRGARTATATKATKTAKTAKTKTAKTKAGKSGKAASGGRARSTGTAAGTRTRGKR